MRSIVGALIVLAALGLLGCAENPCPDGLKVRGAAPPNGTEQQCLKRDGTAHGPWWRWHDNGQKKAEGQFRDGEMYGTSRSWYENGQKKSEGELGPKGRTGTWTDWHENGAKRSEGERQGIRACSGMA